MRGGALSERTNGGPWQGPAALRQGAASTCIRLMRLSSSSAHNACTGTILPQQVGSCSSGLDLHWGNGSHGNNRGRKVSFKQG